MDKVIECFEIVPIGDGLHYLCRDGDGHYFHQHKAESDTSDRLIFESEALAQDYIDRYLDGAKYRPEYVVYNAKYLPKNIIRKV